MADIKASSQIQGRLSPGNARSEAFRAIRSRFSGCYSGATGAIANGQINRPLSGFTGFTDFFTNLEGAKINDFEIYSDRAISLAIKTPGNSSQFAITSIDSFTKLLLHGDSTPIVDSEPTPKAVTAIGSAAYSTVDKKFGTGSILVPNGTSAVQFASSTDFAFGTGDFTVDFWVNFNDVTGNQIFCARRVDVNNDYTFLKNITDHKLRMYFVYLGSFMGNYIMTNSWAPNVGQWYHIAFERIGSHGKIFIDGVAQIVTETNAFGTNDIADIAAVFQVGARNSVTGLKSYVDEFRISKGISRWASDFTPPIVPYGGTIIGAGAVKIYANTLRKIDYIADIQEVYITNLSGATANIEVVAV